MARAFGISIAFHLLLFTTIEIGGRTGLWKHSILPSSFLANLRLTPEQLKKIEDKAARQEQKKEEEPALVFVDVDPANAQQEPPKQAKYYSSANSAAGNPKPQADATIPKIQGPQEKVPKTTPNIRTTQPPEPEKRPEKQEPPPAPETPPPQPLQPAPLQPNLSPAPPTPPKPEAKPEQAEPAPKTQPLPAGDTIMAKSSPSAVRMPSVLQPENRTAPQDPPAARTRPRTLAAARAQRGMPGETMQQRGGVRRETLEASLDVRATPFGAYDAAFIAAVRARWYTLLDERNTPQTNPGKVVVEFRLMQDGRITDIRVGTSEVNEMLAWICQRAITDPAPYARFPSDLRRLLGVDYRDVRFTFHYN